MIEKIGITNFKCFDSYNFTFSNCNLLTGINGMGKSSLIQSFLLLNESYKKLNLDGLILNGDSYNIGFASNAFCDYPVEPTNVIGFNLVFSNKEFCDLKFKVNISDRTNYLEIENKSNSFGVFNESIFTKQFKYINTERIPPSTIFQQSDYTVHEQDYVGIHGEYTANYLLTYGNKLIGNTNLLPQIKDRTLSSLVTRWMNEIRPGFKLPFLDSNPNTGFVEMKYSFIKNNKESSAYTTTNVGFGITYTLPVVVTLLSAKPNDIVVIENPEAHLHPRGQSKIGELIAYVANAGVQVFVETHSDHILNGIRVAIYKKKISNDKVKIFFFKDSNEEGIFKPDIMEPTITEEARLVWSEELGYNWPEGFFDEWDKNIEELLG